MFGTVRRTVVVGIVLMVLSIAASGGAGASDWVEPFSWGSSEVIGVGYVAVGDNVGLWQGIQQSTYGGWAPGFAPGSIAKTDAQFGSITRNYTILWQTQMRALVPTLATDGVVGTQTWNAARFFGLGQPFFSGSNAIYTYNRNGVDPFLIAYNSVFTAWLTQNPFFCSTYATVGSPHVSWIWFQNCTP
jgi:hypothetical protein